MTLLEERPEQVEAPERRLIEVIPGPKNKGILTYLTSTDHKQIGINYMVTSFIMFLIAGAMAILMRVQLAVPNNNFVSLETFNELFTIHGTIMLFVFLGPFAFGTANYLVPIQIGAPDMAFPRFNAFSYWLFLGGCVTLLSSFLCSSGAAQWGWFAYAPLTEYHPLPRPGRRPVDRGRGPGRLLEHVHRHQPHHDRVLLAGAGNGHVPHADLHLEPAGHRLPGPAGLPGAHRRPRPAVDRPAPRDELLRPDPRRPADPVAGPVLVLRPPGGLHPGPAFLRDGHGNDLDLLPEARVRLQGHGLRHAVDRRPVHGRVGAPHVHDRRRAAAVLHHHDPAHLGARPGSSSSTGSGPCSGARSGSTRPCCSPSGS